MRGGRGYGHLPAIAGLPDLAELAAVVDIDEAALAKAHEQYPQARPYRDYRDMLLREPVDAVVVATRTDTHVPITAAAFEAGKHVLLEKPPAQTVAEGEALVALCRRHGLIAGVGLILR